MGGKYLSEEEYWNYAKSGSPEDIKRLEEVVYFAFEIVRISSILL